MPEPLGIAVFASGSGTNLQALLDHRSEAPGWAVRLVVSDKEDAKALERAGKAGIPGVHLPVKGREADDVVRDTLMVLREHAIDLVCLAGYMRLVPAGVVEAYRGRMLNIHPALLPAFGGPGMYGLRVHQAVLAAGCRISGPTVHLVDEEYDRGRIVAQWPVPVLAGDGPEELQARVLAVEHRLYPAVVDHACACLSRGEEVGPLPLGGASFEVN